MIWRPSLLLPGPQMLMPGAWMGAGCCCPTDEFGDSCPGVCAGETPALLTIIFEGIDVEAGCWLYSATTSYRWTDVAAVNDTYILSQSEIIPCVWQYIVTDGIAYRTFTDKFCNDLDEDYTVDLIITAQLVDDKWEISQKIGPALGAPEIPFFFMVSDVLEACEGVILLNGLTGRPLYVAKDGTADLSF